MVSERNLKLPLFWGRLHLGISNSLLAESRHGRVANFYSGLGRGNTEPKTGRTRVFDYKQVEAPCVLYYLGRVQFNIRTPFRLMHYHSLPGSEETTKHKFQS